MFDVVLAGTQKINYTSYTHYIEKHWGCISNCDAFVAGL